jgi:hypothetical protein
VLSNFITQVFAAKKSPLSGVGYAGSFNIESGWAEIASGHFGSCDACSSQVALTRVCKSCGRATGNNVGFLAGRGDGVYSGLSLMVGDRVIGAAFLFDEDNAFAGSAAGEIARLIPEQSLAGNKFEELFVKACEPYMGSKGHLVGSIDAVSMEYSDPGIAVGDLSQGGQGGFTNTDVPFTNGSFNVILYAEPITESPSVALSISLGSDEASFTMGYEAALRPRVAVVILPEFMHLVGPLEEGFDFEAQARVWHGTLVMANLAGGNAAVSSYYNGMFWAIVAATQIPGPDTFWYLYATRAFGHFAQGALLGDADCLSEMVFQIDQSPNNDILDVGVFKDAFAPRGLFEYDDLLNEITALWAREQDESSTAGLSDSATPIPKFCSNCGTPTSDGSFCSNCGQKLGNA